MNADQMLIEIHAKVAAMDARTEDFCGRLERVEADCSEIKTSLAHDRGLDVARDRDLAELRATAQSSGGTYGAAAGGVVGGALVAIKTLWDWVAGGAPTPGN